jgi:hypothetical protein
MSLSGDLRLDGEWHLAERKAQGASVVDLIKRVELPQSVELDTTTFHEEIEFRYPQKPERLARIWPLAAGWSLKGQKLGVPADRKGFPLPLHQDRILVETDISAELQGEITHRAPVALPPSNMPRLANRQRALDGRWPVAAYSRFELGKQQQPARLDRSHLHLMSIQAEALLTEALYSVAP